MFSNRHDMCIFFYLTTYIVSSKDACILQSQKRASYHHTIGNIYSPFQTWYICLLYQFTSFIFKVEFILFLLAWCSMIIYKNPVIYLELWVYKVYIILDSTCIISHSAYIPLLLLFLKGYHHLSICIDNKIGIKWI